MPRTALSEPRQTPRDLDRTTTRQHRSGARLALLGGMLAALGILLMTLGGGVLDVFGVVLACAAIVPTVIGVGLELTAFVGRRANRGRSFA